MVEVVIEILGTVLEVALEAGGGKGGSRVKAVLCLVLGFILMSVFVVLGIHWISSGTLVLGILSLLLGLGILAAFIAAIIRKRV